MQIVYLATTIYLPTDPIPYQPFVILRHNCFNWMPSRRRSLDLTQISCPKHRKIECPWNGGSREGENIHPTKPLLQLFLLLNSKTLLLINHDQPQLMELHIGGQKSVRPYHHINRTIRNPLHDLLLFTCRTESTQLLNHDRPIRKPLPQVPRMLLRQNRRGSQDHNLFTCHHGLKCRANRHLRLSISYITAD